MANYANSRGFAGAFNNLTGILNMFLQNQLNRDNVADDRQYQDKTYEKKLIDGIVTNAVIKGIHDGTLTPYETYLGEPVNNGTRQVNIMGNKQTVPVASPQKIAGDKIDNIDYSTIISGLKSGDIVTRPNTEVINKSKQNNNIIKLTPNMAKLLKERHKEFGIDYTEGEEVPYALFTSSEQAERNKQRIAYNTNKNEKDNARRLIERTEKWAMEQTKYRKSDMYQIRQDLIKTNKDYRKAMEKVYGIKPEKDRGNYKIMQDASGKRAKVYDDGTIEEI